MSLVSDKLQQLAPYDPDLDLTGIHLDANESFLSLPDTLRGEISHKIAALSFNRYPDPSAGGVCAAFAERFRVNKRFVTAGNGSDELISILFNTFLQKGDRVILTEPDFSMYRIYCALAEAEPVVLGKHGDLTFDPLEIASLAVREKVSMIIFSNPCNPTGQGIQAQEVLKIADTAGCLTVVDEAYMDFWNQSVLQQAPMRENLIVLKTLSKVGFAAARLGFAVANEKLSALLKAAKSPYNVNAMTQISGEILLREEKFLSESIRKIVGSRENLFDLFKQLEKKFPGRLKVFESHTNFVTASVKNAAELHKKLKQKGISVRLIADRYFRVTAGTEEENRAFMDALESILRDGADKAE